MKRRVITCLAFAVTALLLAACGPSFGQGPAGTVADKRSHLSCRIVGKQQQCSWRYWLTTRSEFRVGGDVFRACQRGSAYPTCAGVKPKSP